MDNKKIFDREKSFRFTGKSDFKIKKAATTAVDEKLSKDDIKARIEKKYCNFTRLTGQIVRPNPLRRVGRHSRHGWCW